MFIVLWLKYRELLPCSKFIVASIKLRLGYINIFFCKFSIPTLLSFSLTPSGTPPLFSLSHSCTQTHTFTHTAATNAYTPYPTYNPQTLSGLSNSYPSQHMNTSALQNHTQRTLYSEASAVIHSPAAAASLSSSNGLYTPTQRSSLSQSGMMIGMPTFHNWSATSLLPSASSSVSIPTLPSSRHTSSNTGPLHSPLTAQVYSIDSSHMRTHSGGSLDVGDSTYALQQHSPDHLLPECAATEPGQYL